LDPEVNCSIAIFESISSDVKSMKECSSATEARIVEEIYKSVFVDLVMNPQQYGCPLPCTRISYELDLNYFHENSLEDEMLNSNFTLFFYATSPIIEDQVAKLSNLFSRHRGITTLSITTFRITTLSIMTFIITQHKGLLCDTQQKRHSA
jgi:hypothetical protein